MRQDQFLDIMPYICSDFLKLLIKKQEITEEQARIKFYSSTYMLFEQEEKTGIIQYPDV